MKKLLIFLLVLVAPWVAYGQEVTRNVRFNSSTSSTCITLVNTGVQFHVLRWSTQGSVTAGTIKLEKTTAAACSTGFTDVIAAQDWTTSGTAAITSNAANYVRMTGAGYAGTGTIDVTYLGYRIDPTNAGTNSSNPLYVLSTYLDSADNANFPNTTTEKPVGVGGIFESALPTYSSGDKVTFHFDANGQLLVAGGGTGGGTQYTEDLIAAMDPVGNAINLIRADTPGAITSANGDNVAQRGTNYGAAYVTLLSTAGAPVPSATAGAGNVDGTTQRVTLADDGTGRIRIWNGTNTAGVTAAGELSVNVANITTDSADNANFPNTTTEKPVGVGGIFESTLPTYASGDKVTFHFDTNGQLLVAGGGVGGGTQYTEDLIAAPDPVGNAINLIRADTPAGITSANGDNVALRGTNYGAAYVTLLSTAGAPVPSATAGAGNVDATTQRMTLADDGTGRVRLWNGTNTAAVTAAGELSVNVGNLTADSADNANFPNTTTEKPVGVGGIFETTLPTYANGDKVTFHFDANGQLLVAGGSTGGGTQYTEDLIAAMDPIGNAINLIRADTPAAITSADGDNVAQRGTNYGAAYVTLLSSAGTPVPSATAGAGNVDGTTQRMTLADNGTGRLRLWDGTNTVAVTAGGALTVTGGGGGTQYTDNVAAATNPIGNAVNLVRQDTPAAITAANGNNVSQRGTNYGAAYVTLLSSAGAPVPTASTGAGGVDGTTMRVTLATDQAAMVGLAIYPEEAAETGGGNLQMMGAVRRDTPASSSTVSGRNSTLNTTADGALWVTTTPGTTGGWSTFNATAGDGATACTNSAQTVKSTQGTFGGYEVYNPNSSAAFLVIYNATAPTVGTTTAAKVIGIPAGALANYSLPNGVQFSTAITIACVTTETGAGAPTTALDVNINYK